MLEYFSALDAAEATKIVPVKPLPAKVSGISGELAAGLYRNGIKEENFGAIIDDLNVRGRRCSSCLCVFLPPAQLVLLLRVCVCCRVCM